MPDEDVSGGGASAFFAKLAVAKEPLRWTPTAGIISKHSETDLLKSNQPNTLNVNSSNNQSQDLTSPNASVNPSLNLKLSRTFSTANKRKQKSQSSNSQPQSQAQQQQYQPPQHDTYSFTGAASGGVSVAVGAGWGIGSLMEPRTVSLSKSYSSINNYQPASSWIANGWDAVVEGEDKSTIHIFSPRQQQQQPQGHQREDSTSIQEWPSPMPSNHANNQWQNNYTNNIDNSTPEWGSTLLFPPTSPAPASNFWRNPAASPVQNIAPLIPQHQQQQPSYPVDNFYDRDLPVPIPVPVPQPQPQPQSQQQPPTWSSETVGNGRWKILELIGAGSFGQVFAAVDLQTGVHVAIKRELTAIRRQQLPHE
ncbi:hypothetical protein HK100_008840, partial [Physocladia obscura]